MRMMRIDPERDGLLVLFYSSLFFLVVVASLDCEFPLRVSFDEQPAGKAVLSLYC